ncbi:heavy metal-associated isoprenylated plant protein 16-like [Lycium barbarum]|uniref:heavy metal-associated isoprenylated plant protein 16-like n=1 Tax=Lycium barbarum TaxID=112863 RepID=UPI00293EE9E9|nr:heavy metal-associated isoprenylated plant protein 16-like [Lycium barbarum]
MKQKVVIRLSWQGNDQESRSKAVETAVSRPGVESATLQGDGRNQLEVVGEQIGAVTLTKLLREKLGQAELVSVGPATAAGNKDSAIAIAAAAATAAGAAATATATATAADN